MNSTDDHNVDVAALSRPCLARLSRDVRAELTDRENVDRAALLENMKATAAAAGFDPSLVSMSTMASPLADSTAAAALVALSG